MAHRHRRPVTVDDDRRDHREQVVARESSPAKGDARSRNLARIGASRLPAVAGAGNIADHVSQPFAVAGVCPGGRLHRRVGWSVCVRASLGQGRGGAAVSINWSARNLLPAILSVVLVACGAGTEGGRSGTSTGTGTGPAAATAIPASLAPFGDGYPSAGDPCRRLGESAATVDFLDHTAILVGCPSAERAAAVGGKVVATVDGVTLVSIPTGDANAGLAESQAGAVGPARGEDGTTLVEVTKPDGTKRAIYFRGTTPFGADGAEADGSAGWSFEVSRRDDQNVIKYGPETYVIVDAFVVGG